MGTVVVVVVVVVVAVGVLKMGEDCHVRFAMKGMLVQG